MRPLPPIVDEDIQGDEHGFEFHAAPSSDREAIGVAAVVRWLGDEHSGRRKAAQLILHLRLRHFTLLLLLTPPVPGNAPRLVHIEHQDHE